MRCSVTGGLILNIKKCDKSYHLSKSGDL
jgi:hypothetical protein